MRVARRVALGYIVLIFLPAILLVVQIFAIRRLQVANQQNSGDNLRIALAMVELVRDRDVLEEHARRYFGLGILSSKDELKISVQSFENSLREIRDYRGTERQQAEVDRLVRFWGEFNDVLSKKEPALRGKGPAEEFPADLAEQLDKLRAQSLTVYHAALQEMKKQAEDSRTSSARTEFIAWWIGGATLVLGILVSFLTVRSISIPLRNLSEGTRAITEGKLFYRLDTSRNDELSQIAKDFNTLAESLSGRTGTADQERGGN